MTTKTEKIHVWGARANNLKNIDVEIPVKQLTVITGMSGSGKSSLAFDTIFAEGQRRYMETFSAYARYFIGDMERPDVDKITGLSPVISIEQKTTNRNPRSTVGTITEIYDFLRLLYARIADAYSYETGERMVKYTEEQLLEMILESYEGKAVYLLAPLVRQRKGHYRELFESMRKKGYLQIRVDDETQEIKRGMKVDRYKNHNIEVVIDKLIVNAKDKERIKKSLQLAMRMGDGVIMVSDKGTGVVKNYSKRLMCPTTGIAYRDPAPNNFSFNSPEGACPKCKGLGYTNEIDLKKIIPDTGKSIHEGGIVSLGKYKNQMIFWQIETILQEAGCDIKTPISEIPAEIMEDILYGRMQRVKISKALTHTGSDFFCNYEGLIKYLQAIIENDDSVKGQKWAEQFLCTCSCSRCQGHRLKTESLSFKIKDKNIAELSEMDVADLYDWMDGLDKHISAKNKRIAGEIIKEIRQRLRFLIDVGLDYLSLNRTSTSLSGGESQRIRLATQIGSQLVNVIYILDEPSIGLHQRDNVRLISSLKGLRDVGNTVIVVEHDKDMMLNADYLIEIGPKAGRKGGELVFEGTLEQMLKRSTITSSYLNGQTRIDIPEKRRKGNGKSIVITGASGNNLKNVNVKIPLNTLTVVTGVSGSGKSTLINETLQPILSSHFYGSHKKPLAYETIEGLEHIDKVVTVDQSPIGKTPRSNPATYTGVFNEIRTLFYNLPEANIRGYKPGRFSFNVKGGRCEACSGNGYKTIEMKVLPDVMVPCEVCRGKRYNRETLEVRYRGKNISDVLEMTVNQAVDFFENIPQILSKIKSMQDVGLGYIKLGQPSTTLSGGECQRIKLAAELSKKDTSKTMYILDEPTTGLHFEDIKMLMGVLQQLVDRGNTVIVIEHNLDVIKQADHIIDVGPEGGKNGGQIVITGTPEHVACINKGFTAAFIKEELKQ